jgi:hypothetical protein
MKMSACTAALRLEGIEHDAHAIVPVQFGDFFGQRHFGEFSPATMVARGGPAPASISQKGRDRWEMGIMKKWRASLSKRKLRQAFLDLPAAARDVTESAAHFLQAPQRQRPARAGKGRAARKSRRGSSRAILPGAGRAATGFALASPAAARSIPAPARTFAPATAARRPLWPREIDRFGGKPGRFP